MTSIIVEVLISIDDPRRMVLWNYPHRCALGVDEYGVERRTREAGPRLFRHPFRQSSPMWAYLGQLLEDHYKLCIVRQSSLSSMSVTLHVNDLLWSLLSFANMKSGSMRSPTLHMQCTQSDRPRTVVIALLLDLNHHSPMLAAPPRWEVACAIGARLMIWSPKLTSTHPSSTFIAYYPHAQALESGV